ncbi:MAG: hypothetical protein KA239_04200 [Bacteroidia bacterium]|nr:hypothetical protein [Bacteroidia bacterium]
MKLRYVLGILLLSAFGFACKPSPQPKPAEAAKTMVAQDSAIESNTSSADGEPVKAALDSILQKARLGDCNGMAPLLVYREGDGNDAWHRGLRYETPEEQLAAEKECAKLQVLVTGLQAHEYLEFATEKEREGEWLIWKVALHYQDGENDEKVFAFLKIGAQYLLGDID